MSREVSAYSQSLSSKSRRPSDNCRCWWCVSLTRYGCFTHSFACDWCSCTCYCLDGVDSLLSIVQMPRGVPVATVAINNSTNAALLAIRMLRISDTVSSQGSSYFYLLLHSQSEQE